MKQAGITKVGDSYPAYINAQKVEDGVMLTIRGEAIDVPKYPNGEGGYKLPGAEAQIMLSEAEFQYLQTVLRGLQ